MALTITIPDALAEKLRQQASEHQRTFDKEVVEVLKTGLAERRRLTPAEFVAEVRARGLHSPDEATAWIREDRDARSGD